MMIVFKGKGILVPVFMFIAFIVVIGLYQLLKNSIPIDVDRNISLVFGLIGLIWGLITWYASRDFYRNKNGEKVEIDLDNRFFFIKMKTIGKVIALMGSVLVLYGIYNFLKS